MIRSKHDDDEALRRLARANAKLGRHERLTNIILGCLTFAAGIALGLLIGHMAGVPWLSHGQ